MSKKAIVIGASRGIGKETVLELLEKGFHVLALSRNTQPLTSIANPNLQVHSFDLASSQLKSELASIIETYPCFDIVINNAGFLVNKPFAEITKEELLMMFQVNVMGVFESLQVLYPKLKGRNAHVVNISSMGGFQGSAKFPGLSAYASSKAAVASLSEQLAEEWKEDQIKVNALCLGAVQTEMLAAAFPGYQAPLSAKEMAAFITDFADRQHQWMNGKIIPVSISTP